MSPSADAANPVLLALDASVLVPPPQEPSSFCALISQVRAAVFAAVIWTVVGIRFSCCSAIAVASVSAEVLSVQDWLAALGRR